MRRTNVKLEILCAIAVWLFGLTVSAVAGTPCVVPHNGAGTADLPPIGCDYTTPGDAFRIVEGLPNGTTIELEGILMDFICDDQPCPICSLALPPGTCEMLGGSLGGHGHCFEATLDLTVTGTGSLAGFNRHLAVPVCGEVHTGSRNPGDPVQAFVTDFYRLDGELFGDPDFCTFRIRWGTDYGLPSPGHTTLTDLGDDTFDFDVDSFFDITYQIEFEGCPDSALLKEYAGTTIGTIRMATGFEEGWPCKPRPDGLACLRVDCNSPGDECQPTGVNFDPVTGEIIVLDCECRGPNECYVDSSSASVYGCMAPDNGTGTPNLPPLDCDYTSPNDVFRITEGLPDGTTIELDGILMNFFCDDQPCGICSLKLPAGTCEMAGGSLTGHGHCFEATLDLTVTGTGSLTGFNRHLAVPVCGEVHTAPRNPGDPVQAFVTDFYRLDGELFGDPDFCTFRIRWGTNYSLPSPGHMTLTQLSSGDFAVDSFFDITYQIEFEGCPDSAALKEYAGTTTGTIRMETGADPVPPACTADCPYGYICDDVIVYKPDQTIDVNCRCLAVDCEPTKDGSACEAAACPGADRCKPTCVNYDPNTGHITVLDCNCQGYSECHVDITGGEPIRPTCTGDCPACMFCGEIITDNPNGTINICCGCEHDADLNGDGKVDFKDLAILAGQWLRGTP